MRCFGQVHDYEVLGPLGFGRVYFIDCAQDGCEIETHLASSGSGNLYSQCNIVYDVYGKLVSAPKRGYVGDHIGEYSRGY